MARRAKGGDRLRLLIVGGYGTFGGGPGSTLKEFNTRFDIDMQLLWEFQALGFGNRARVSCARERWKMARRCSSVPTLN